MPPSDLLEIEALHKVIDELPKRLEGANNNTVCFLSTVTERKSICRIHERGDNPVNAVE
jgi:hypothetical protein